MLTYFIPRINVSYVMSMQHFKLKFLFKYNQNKKNSKYKFYFSLNKTKKKMEMFQKKNLSITFCIKKK